MNSLGSGSGSGVRVVVKVLGTVDDVDMCDCCGRKDLKKTVALQFEDAEPVYYGTTCAAHALKRPVKEFRKEVRSIDEENRAAGVRAGMNKMIDATRKWKAWLDIQVPELFGETFRQIESLGGYIAAKRLYRNMVEDTFA